MSLSEPLIVLDDTGIDILRALHRHESAHETFQVIEILLFTV